jgi:hypothetical protein
MKQRSSHGNGRVLTVHQSDRSLSRQNGKDQRLTTLNEPHRRILSRVRCIALLCRDAPCVENLTRVEPTHICWIKRHYTERSAVTRDKFDLIRLTGTVHKHDCSHITNLKAMFGQ